MTTYGLPAEHARADRGLFASRLYSAGRRVRSVSAAEMLTILDPEPDEPESLRKSYLWKTDHSTPSVQPSAA